jgi:hypothetical protein
VGNVETKNESKVAGVGCGTRNCFGRQQTYLLATIRNLVESCESTKTEAVGGLGRLRSDHRPGMPITAEHGAVRQQREAVRQGVQRLVSS